MKKKFAFLVHPRDREDWENTFWPARFLSKDMLNYIGQKIKNKELSHVIYKGVEGYLINIPLLPEYILSKPRLVQKYVLGASTRLIDLGVNVIGLGALLAPITIGGEWLRKKLLQLYPNKNIIVTNGNSLTAAMTAEGVQQAAELRNLQLSSIKIAIIGATGSVGTGVSQLLAGEIEQPHFLLISRTITKLENLKKKILNVNAAADIELDTSLIHVKNVNLVVVLTSAAGTILEDANLKEHAVVYDVTQPSNISQSIINGRQDLLVIDGGLVSTPGLDWGVNLRLPENTSFGCLAETMFIAENGGFGNFDFTGEVNINTAKEMAKVAKEHGFVHAPLTSFRRLVLKEEMRGQIYLAERKYLKKFSLLL